MTILSRRRAQLAISPAISAPLNSAPLPHTTQDCSLCECSHHEGIDREKHMKVRGQRGESRRNRLRNITEREQERVRINRRRTWSNGLSLMHFAPSQVCLAQHTVSLSSICFICPIFSIQFFLNCAYFIFCWLWFVWFPSHELAQPARLIQKRLDPGRVNKYDWLSALWEVGHDYFWMCIVFCRVLLEDP